MYRFTIKDKIRRLRSGAIALMFLAAYGVAALAPFVPVQTVLAETIHKSYVCKYVGTPGVDERLQTGQNPIWVDNHSLLGHDGTTYVGELFSDAQSRSVVIFANTPKLDPEPTISDCPATSPDKDATASFTLVPATCTADGSVTFNETFATLTAGGETTPGAHTATFTATIGHVFVDGTTTLTLSYTVPSQLNPNSEACEIAIPRDATASFTLIPATCTVDGSVTFSNAHATLTSGGQTTPGLHSAIFTATPGHLFADGTNTLTLSYTVPSMLDGEECVDTSHQPITFCHATPPDTAKNGYQKITTDVGAFYNDGHINHAADIYPAGSFTKGGHDYSWDAQGDQSLLQYPDCMKPTPKDATASFTLVPATCTADGSVTFAETFATLTAGGETTPGAHTATFTADAGHLFANSTPTLVLNYTVAPKLSADSDECFVPPTHVTPADPTVAPVCGPNNDTVTLPTQTGVTYTSTGWVNGQLTVTATAKDGFVLDGTHSWTFTDANTSCGQVLGTSTTTPNVLAASTTTPAAPQLENTGNNFILPMFMSMGVLGLAIVTVLQNSTRKSKFVLFAERMVNKFMQAIQQPFMVPVV